MLDPCPPIDSITLAGNFPKGVLSKFLERFNVIPCTPKGYDNQIGTDTIMTCAVEH